MSTFTQIYYHIVFLTKNRKPVLLAADREPLFRYIWGIIKNNEGHLYRINGVEDHVHIFTSLHPTVCLADLVKAIKVSTGQWMKSERLYPDFSHWQDGQEEHHKKTTFQNGNHSVMGNAYRIYVECGGNDAAFAPLTSRTLHNSGKSGVVAAALHIATPADSRFSPSGKLRCDHG